MPVYPGAPLSSAPVARSVSATTVLRNSGMKKRLIFAALSDMPINRTQNERSDCAGKARRMAKAESASARQRLVADYAPGVQHGAKRVHDLVPAGTPARLHQGHRERLAGIPGSSRPRFVVDHY